MSMPKISIKNADIERKHCFLFQRQGSAAVFDNVQARTEIINILGLKKMGNIVQQYLRKNRLK